MGNERDSYPIVDPDSKSYSILCRAIPICRFAFFVGNADLRSLRNLSHSQFTRLIQTYGL